VIEADSVRAVVNKSVELREGFNIANRVVSQFGLVSEIQRSKVRHTKSELSFSYFPPTETRFSKHANS
jgi:hypothetical protein